MRTVRVALGERSYSILIGRGLFARLGRMAKSEFPGGRALVVTDRKVVPVYGARAAASLERAGLETEIFAVPAGERSKSLRQLSRIYDRLAALGFERGCGIVSLGGGVVGDLAGYAAATYLRGIPFIQAPTSLLAQVDSAVGGKTGIDHRAGKNLIGAFFQPRAVVCDVAALRTLPPREFRAGLAEVVKHAVIADARLFAYLENNAEEILRLQGPALERIIWACCRIKARVVEKDEREAGSRQILNFGHTLGHAVEALAGYSRRMLHGEAVSIGMAAAARLSCLAGKCKERDADRLLALLGRFGLPTSMRRVPALASLRRLVSRDKKSRGGKARFVLMACIGKVVPGCEVDAGGWRAALGG